MAFYWLSIFILVLIIICVAIDIYLLFRNKSSIRVIRILPERFSNGDENPVSIYIHNAYPFKVVLGVVDEIPDIFQIRDFYKVTILEPNSDSQFVYYLKPKERGIYFFGAVNVFVKTPLRLAMRRWVFPVSKEVAVYPSFLQMKRYELMAVSNQLYQYGNHKLKKIGQSLEFEQIKNYVVGDDVRNINWKASARRNEVMLNHYRDERSQSVYCLIDKGRVMKMPFNQMTLLDYSINASLALLNIALKKGDKAGLISFSKDLDVFINHEQVWANGTNFTNAKFTAKIATPNGTSGGLFGDGGAAYTGELLLYDIANTGTLSTILNGAQINTKNTAKGFVYNSITTYPVPANANSQILQCINFTEAQTGGIALISVVNGGFGFRSEPSLLVESHYDTQISENYDYLNENEISNKRAYWQTFKDLGQIAHVYINNGGSGYANGDTITFFGRGYGGNAFVNVNASGSIVTVTLNDRGEGHTVRPSCNITTSGGAGAVLTAYLFGDGFTSTIDTSAIGRVRDIRLIYRGFDYIATPNVSLKVIDTVISPISEAQQFTEQEYIYQGSSLSTSTFRANVKSYNRNTNVLRLYDFSGSIDTTVALISANGVTCNVNTTAVVPAPAQYLATTIASGLPNPMYYGNGRAKANALFANGLIEFNGFYLNSDGFPSADKVLQDDDIYHNFSYIVQSEKSLIEFETPLKNIVHPAGMKVAAKTIIKSISNNDADASSNVNLILSINSGSTITVSNSFSNTITGTNTEFLSPEHKVNVGDLFIIVDDSNPLRTQSKVVTSVTSNTSLNIKGDFIYTGQGKLKTNSSNTLVQVSANINAISDFIDTGDQIRMNVINMRLSGTVNVVGNTITGNTTGANTTYFVGNVVVGSEVLINNQTRTVTAVSNNNQLIVNTAFSYNETNKYINANSILLKTITSISGNNMTMNSAIFANNNGLTYQIIPSYTGYNYRVVTLTSE